MVWLPDGENISKIYLFFSTEYTNVADTCDICLSCAVYKITYLLTDGRTPHDCTGRAYCIASRGNSSKSHKALLSVCTNSMTLNNLDRP